MLQTICLDQYLLDVEYSYESGDQYHCLDWIDLSVLSGTICLEDETCVDMSDHEVYCVGEMFGGEIERKLIEELRDGNY